MRVRPRNRAAGPEGNWAPGEIISVSEACGRAMIAGGYAELVKEPKRAEPEKPKKPVPESAMIEPQEETADLPAPRRRRRPRDASMSES